MGIIKKSFCTTLLEFLCWLSTELIECCLVKISGVVNFLDVLITKSNDVYGSAAISAL